MGLEYRSFVGTESVDTTDDGVIFGLAIPYNRETVIGDLKRNGFREQIAPGACSKSLREADIVALYNHDSSRPLGRTSAGNLTLTNTVRGVEPELKPVDTSYSRDLAELVRSKVIKGWSFGFEVLKDDWTDDKGRASDEWTGTNRVIREMKLIEVSPVTFPAYESTIIQARDKHSAAYGTRAASAKDVSEVSMEFKCPKCGEENQYGHFCEQCGANMTPDPKYCGKCGAKMEGAREDHVCADTRGGNAPGNGKLPYGKVKYADPGYRNGQKRYPVDSKQHVKAAWAYINKKKNAGYYSAEQLAHIKGVIRKAAKKFGIKITDDRRGVELALVWRTEIKARKEERSLLRKSKLSNGTEKRIPQIAAALNQALQLFGNTDAKSLPDDVQRAIALVSSATTHANHIQEHEKLTPMDAISKNDKLGRADDMTSAATRNGKPAKATSKLPDDDALRLEFAKALSRGIATDK